MVVEAVLVIFSSNLSSFLLQLKAQVIRTTISDQAANFLSIMGLELL